MTFYQVEIIIGSKNDRTAVEESKMLDVLTECSVRWRLSVISAHRNSDALREFCANNWGSTNVFIGVAGMSAALPGAIAAELMGRRPVIGVPLPSEGFPDAADALSAMVRLPPGVVVLVTGIGKTGLYNAAIAAAQIVADKDSDVLHKFYPFLAKKRQEKSAEIGVATSDQP